MLEKEIFQKMHPFKIFFCFFYDENFLIFFKGQHFSEKLLFQKFLNKILKQILEKEIFKKMHPFKIFFCFF